MLMSDYVALLSEARLVLDRYMFDGEILRDDVAEICAKIDDAVPTISENNRPRIVQGIERAA